MNRDAALAALQSRALDKRLEAARALVSRARSEDAAQLQEALGRETVVWVQTALRLALKRALKKRLTPDDDTQGEDVVPAEAVEQIRTIAVNAVTKQIVHEIAPVVGVLKLHAQREVADYPASKTNEQVERLSNWLDALDRLSDAAVAPALAEFDMAEAIRKICEAESTGHIARVELAGSSPLLTVGDRTLVELAFANGVRNALEAVELFHPGSTDMPPVVVNWGETNTDLWIAVLDRGMGPPGAASRAFEIGSTTKEGHLGMGLATARQAMQSLGGEVSLSLRADGGGARLDLRWSKVAREQ